jgi:hypothetical protein
MVISFQLSSLMRSLCAIDNERVADHQACGGLQSERTAAAISSGDPIGNRYAFQHRAKGVSLPSGHRRMKDAGQTALIRIPFAAYSGATLLVRPITPCLAA